MQVSFEKSPYFESITQSEIFKDEKCIFDHVKKHPQFSYGNVTYEQFSEKYVEEGLLERKLIALPVALWSGIVQTICHLVLAIFQMSHFKTVCYYAGRDLQESFGWLITLFNDKCGQYHVQESRFHKSCYDCFFIEKMEADSPVHTPVRAPQRHDSMLNVSSVSASPFSSSFNRRNVSPNSTLNVSSVSASPFSPSFNRRNVSPITYRSQQGSGPFTRFFSGRSFNSLDNIFRHNTPSPLFKSTLHSFGDLSQQGANPFSSIDVDDLDEFLPRRLSFGN